MSSFFQTFGKPGAPKSKAPVIRKEIRTVKKPATPQAVNGAIPRPTSRPPSNSPAPRITNGHSRPSPASRPSPRPAPKGKDRLSVPRTKSLKRKSASPAAVFGSSSEGESDQELDFDRRAKKAKSTNSPPPDTKRRLRDVEHWDESEGKRNTFSLEHSVNITTGPYEKDYRPIFYGDETTEVELQYPSASQRERFRLVAPREASEYDPLNDLVQTITSILQHYIPPEQSEIHLDSSTGIPWLLHRASKNRDFATFQRTLDTFNNLVDKSLSSGAVAKCIDALPRIPMVLVERILLQIYSRTVSPRVDILRRYTVGSDNVYGELLPPFCSQVFKDSRLDSSSVFLDLGSGVGNVVLQAALEIGCESWGVEMTPNACDIAALQGAEFPARCRMWGLAVGDVHLLQGDFLQDARVGEVLRRADVVLVNNQAFQPDTNGKITDLLLDLKEGARVVSLKSFVPSGFKLTPRTYGSSCATLEVVRKEFWGDWVSWTNAPGEYFVATKDSSRINRVLDVKT